MGIADSKILAESLLSACQIAEREGKDRLDETRFWKDENIIEASKKIYKYIPRDIRSNSRQPAIKKAIARSRHVKVPQLVQDLQDKRESLFSRHLAKDWTHGSPIASQSSPASTPIPLSVSSLAGFYRLVVHCERQQELEKIRLRLLYVSFYRLKEYVQPSTQYHHYDAAAFIAQVIKESGAGDNLDVVQGQVRRWIGLGERYSLLANDLGGPGALYILPDNGGESIWTKELPKSATHPNRMAMIEKLRQQRLPEKAGNLHNLAEHDITQIWKPMKASLDKVLEKQLSETSYQGAARSRPQASEETENRQLESDLPVRHQSSSGMSSEGRTGVLISTHNKPESPPSQIGTPMQMSAVHSDQASLEIVQDTSRPSYNQSGFRAPLVNQPDSIMPRFQPCELTPSHIPPGSIPCDNDIFQHGDLTAASSAQFSIAVNDQSNHCPNPLDVTRSSIATITPADFPQAFAMTSTMAPADYPQLFLYQQGTVTPADYPLMFPCGQSQYVGSPNPQLIVQS